MGTLEDYLDDESIDNLFNRYSNVIVAEIDVDAQLENGKMVGQVVVSIESNKEYSSSDLHDIFKELEKSNGIRYRMKSPRALGRHLATRREILEQVKILESRRLNNKYLYTILEEVNN